MKTMNISIKLLSLALLALYVASVPIAAQQPKPCESTESKQFDFWIGEWNLSWKNPESNTLSGTNKISKIMNSCVVQENFDGNPGMNFKGMSVSVYDRRINKWRQTWVDDQGGYLEFIGKYKNNKMTLSREFEVDGQKKKQRMVFYNIKENSMDWDWETSGDDGKSWKLAWRIHYDRKK